MVCTALLSAALVTDAARPKNRTTPKITARYFMVISRRFGTSRESNDQDALTSPVEQDGAHQRPVLSRPRGRGFGWSAVILTSASYLVLSSVKENLRLGGLLVSNSSSH